MKGSLEVVCIKNVEDELLSNIPKTAPGGWDERQIIDLTQHIMNRPKPIRIQPNHHKSMIFELIRTNMNWSYTTQNDPNRLERTRT